MEEESKKKSGILYLASFLDSESFKELFILFQRDKDMKHQIKSQSNSVPKYGDLDILKQAQALRKRQDFKVRLEREPDTTDKSWSRPGRCWGGREVMSGRGLLICAKSWLRKHPQPFRSHKPRKTRLPSKEKRDWGCF